MIKKITLPSLRAGSKETGKVVKYTTCNKIVDDDLDEVAVISNAAPESVRYGSGHHSTANGPRVVPGIITAGMDRSKVLTSSLSGSAIQKYYFLLMFQRMYLILYDPQKAFNRDIF